jgi:hypothetical protein
MRKLFNKLRRSGKKSNALLPSLIEGEVARLKREIAEKTPDNPCLFGYQVFSQNDEDGIIQHILARLPQEQLTKSFIEIGCGDGLQNNTHLLALQGWRGYWVDGSQENIDAIGALGNSDKLKAVCRFVDKENIGTLIKEACAFLRTKDIDFFSLDIDGNDLHLVTEALRHMTPKIVCIEYNAKFPPPLSFAIRYNPAHVWQSDDYFGASLQAFIDALKDYQLVCCNLAGVNAFFVRKDYAGAFTFYPPEKLYQKARYRLSHASGHPSSMKWLKDALATG